MKPNIVSAIPQNKKSALLRKTPEELEELKKMPSEHNRYLDLFTQLSIIEDSFEFVHLIFHFDPFQCVYAGSTFEKIYGYSCREIYERSDLLYEIAHPEDTAFLMQQIKSLFKDGYNEFVYRIITKNSEVKHIKTNAWYVQDEGQSYVMNCFQKDVTGQMETGNRFKRGLQKHHHISDIAITLNSTDDFEYKLQQTIDKIGGSVQADQVSLYEIDSEQEQMVCRYVWAKQEPVIPQGIVVKIPTLNHLPEYISTLQFTEGDKPDGFMRCWKCPAQVQSLMLIPVRIKQKMFGFIELVSIRKRKWQDDDFSFACTIGNMTANFYDRKNINDELALNYLNQELMANISYRLNQYADDNEQVLRTVLGYIGIKNPGVERVYIYVYDEENHRFRKTHDYANPSLNPKYASQEEYDSSLFENLLPALKGGKPHHISDISQLRPELQNLVKPLGIKSILVTPLFTGGRLYGIFGYHIYSHCHVWKKSEIEITQSFADAISHFIERQAIMKKLKNSEMKFKNISANLPGCVFQATLSPTEEITLDYISPQFEQWSGTKPSSKISLKKIQQIIHPNNRDAFFKVKKELERLHPEISFEGRFYFPAIGFKWLIVKATMLDVKPSGELIYNGLLIDVTENKQTELKLADANVSIQSIINNLESGVLLVDDYNNVLYSNEKLGEMLVSEWDVSADQSGILDATFNLVRDSAGLKNQTRELMKKRIEERGRELFFNKTAEFITRDYIPVFRDHKFFAHLFIFNNVTHTKLQDLEVQKSYKRVRTIIDYSDIGVVLLSENEKVMIVNDQFLRLFHIEEPASNFVNQWFRVLWDRMCENVHINGISREQIRDVVYSDKRVLNREIIINDISTMQCFIEPVAYDNQMQKEMYETLIQVVDITSQRNIEQTLRKAKEEAETIAKAKSHILTSMSHEIRTPLNGILGFSSMLKESLTDPYQREMAEVIDQSGRRLLDTMNAILDFSMVQSEKKSFKISTVNVNHMLQEQISTHRTMALQKGLYLYAEVRGVIGIAIADRALYKILYNLINNGIKYTVDGGVKVEAGMVSIEDSEWLELKVIDTGVGIDEVKHNTIFEPFRQESEGYGRAFEGTGLGLTLVKEYVQKMNGKISLASRKDEGSTFTVLLPNAYYENHNILSEIIGIPPKQL
ncbi:MAG: PAS domain-containing protein [Bacteroidales bacterium]|jgi:signal transduction histidine kinase/GAF domain-containing protein|nr:PAS domain-containing protein [Bacteroidales bacterium]